MRDFPLVKHAYRVDEACYVIGIGRTKFYEEAKKGRIKLAKIGARTIATNIPEYIELLKIEASDASVSR